MKRLFIFFTVALLIGITCCEKDSDSTIDGNKITFLKTNPGGCNNENLDNLKSIYENYVDTVEFNVISNDTLNVFVGINYICCAPFVSETEIVGDTLKMTISDTCPNLGQSCYCKCNCYYTWDFQFIDFEKKEYAFIIFLNDPREDNPIIFKEGKIDLSK